MENNIIKTLNGWAVYDEAAHTDIENIKTDYAKKTEIPDVPTAVSELSNDTGFITSADLPDTSNFATKDEIPDVSGFLTEHQSLEAYALKTEIPSAPDLSSYYTKTEIDNLIGDVDAVLAQLGVTE